MATAQEALKDDWADPSLITAAELTLWAGAIHRARWGVVSVAHDDTANLDISDGSTPEDRYPVILITGALTAARNVVVRTASGWWIVINSTTGGFAITVKTSGGTGISIAAGEAAWLRGDGTNVVSMIAADAAPAAIAAAGAAGTSNQLAREDHTHALAATGAHAATVADANIIGGVPVVHRIDVPAGATGDVDVTLTHKTRVTDVRLVKKSAAGGGAGTIQVKNGANAITNAMSIDVADQTVVRAGTIDDAQWEIAAAGTLRVTRTRTASVDETCTVIVEGLRVA